MKYTTPVFRSLLLLISLMVLGGVASAQSPDPTSLTFNDTDGRRVTFTIFGTIVYPRQNNVVSRGYEVVYDADSRAFYLNSSFNSGIVPVSLSADQPDEHVLSKVERVYVRAVVRTADGKLTITHRYIWRGGSSKIDAVVTVKNNTGFPLKLNEVSILTPPRGSTPGKSSNPATPSTPGRSSNPATPSTRTTSTQFACPCMPALPFDGSEVDSTIVTIPPDQEEYVKTTASYPEEPLQPDSSVDVPGCEPMPGEVSLSFDC
jgi:hypothetical protein